MRLDLLPVCAALLVAAFPLHAQKSRISDTILQKDGHRIRGVEVTEMTKTSVAYKRGSTEEKIAANEVAQILWEPAPELLTQARDKERRGEHAAAADLYLEAARVAERRVIQLEAKFLGARAALADAGTDAAKAASAGAALQSYLGEAPDGFYVPHARLLVARALARQGKAAEAEAALKELEATVESESWGLAWDARTKFERAQALVALGRADDARATYRDVVSAVDAARGGGNKDPQLVELKTQSLVGEGETYIAEGKHDDALRFFRKYADASGGAATLQAAALAGEGQALFLKAEASGTDAGLREAQLALARASILDTDSGDTTAKALFYSGKVLLALGPDRERDARSRALTYFDTVIRYHTATPWAAEARVEVHK